MEFWAGWFDYWGHPRNAYNNQKFETTLREVVKRGASINFYMFHGGTNFGFYSGAISLEKGYYTGSEIFPYVENAFLNLNLYFQLT